MTAFHIRRQSRLREIALMAAVAACWSMSALPWAAAGESSLFKLEAGEWPQSCELDSGRRASAKGAGLSEAEGRRGAQLKETGYISIAPRGDDDPLGGALSQLTISAAIHPDEAAPYPVYFERVTKGGRGIPGFFYFYSQTRRGDASERETDLRFAFTLPDGQRKLYVSTRRWTMRQGEWRQVACVLEKGRLFFYLDGKQLGETLAFEESEIPALPKPWLFRGGSQLSGLMSNLLVSPVALDAGVIATLHRNAALPPETKAALP